MKNEMNRNNCVYLNKMKLLFFPYLLRIWNENFYREEGGKRKAEAWIIIITSLSMEINHENYEEQNDNNSYCVS